MKYFSIFSGIGGFENGIEKAKPEWQCVGYSEIDKYATAIYQYHYPEHRKYGDATAINTDELPDFDFLCGGFPCQAFSVAGKRRGFSDTRGTLFFEIARILRDKRPRYFLLENVKGLLSHEDGKTFQTILGVLADIGYLVQWQVLNSKNFGVPQNRERVFIAGCFGEGCGREILHIGESDRGNKEGGYGEDIVCGTISTKNQSGQLNIDHGTTLIANAIDSNYYEGMDNHQQRTMVLHDKRDGIYEENSPCLRETTNNNVVVLSGTHGYNHGGKKKLPSVNKSNQLDENELVEINQINNPTHSFNRIYGSEMHERRIRRLTPTECERLQGFPDNWTKYGIDENGNKINISDTQRYKCLGNAVTTNVIEWIVSNWF